MLKKLIYAAFITLVVTLAITLTAFAGIGQGLINAPVLGTRNDFPGWLGYRFTMNKDATVVALGRPSDKMENVHAISIWDTETWEKLAEVTVTPGSPEENGFKYAALSSTIELKAGKMYIIVSSETKDGDPWVDAGDTSVSGKYDKNTATIIGNAYSGAGSKSDDPDNPEEFGPEELLGGTTPPQNTGLDGERGYVIPTFWIDDGNVDWDLLAASVQKAPDTVKDNTDSNGGSGDASSSGGKDVPVTGDKSMTVFAVAALAVSAAGVVVIVVFKKRTKKVN